MGLREFMPQTPEGLQNKKEADERERKEIADREAQDRLAEMSGSEDQFTDLEQRARGGERPTEAIIDVTLAELRKKYEPQRQAGKSIFGRQKTMFKMYATNNLMDDHREDFYSGWTQDDFKTAYAKMEEQDVNAND